MKVSVCTSVLNQSEYLRKMIDSVRAQTIPDWEAIIVDDGSTEDIKGLIESYGDSRLVYVRFPENRGIPHGLNHALSLASGDYISVLSADEWIWERKFEVQAAWMDEHPGIGCTWGLPWSGPMGERPGYEQYHYRAHNRSREGWIRTLLRLENIPIGGASLLMRRECYKAIGGFDPQFFHCSDLEWFVRFFQKYQGWILPYRFADAAQPDDRLTAPKPNSEELFAADIKKVHAKHKIVLPPTPVKACVTIGIPVRDMEKYVKASIDSVLAQTVPCALHVIDDASSDGTADVLAEILPPGTVFEKIEENIGVAAANNRMLAMCETEFYLPFSADDLLDPTFVARCLKEFHDDPFLEMVASRTDFIDADGAELSKDHLFWKIPAATNRPRDQWLQVLQYGNHYFGAGMYRAQALRDVGGWDDSVGCLCDYDVYLKLLQRENIKIIEENLTHTRSHAGQQSQLHSDDPAVRWQWGQDLRVNYHRIKSRYFPPRKKVIIATPFYEMRGFSPYIASLAATVQVLTRLGIEHEFWELSGDSYVDRAKNTIMNKFLEDPAATDLFMIDSDMQWDSQSFVNMLQMPFEIIMGSYPQKNGWNIWTAQPKLQERDGQHFPEGVIMSNGEPVLKANYLAGGYIRVARTALEKYKEKFADLVYMDQGADPSNPHRVYTEFFTCERAQMGGEGPMLRWGEDRVFGRRMKELGIEAWIYPNASIGHYGIKGWQG
jgi:glycosyltransferase involved in cell wall biosynthesis